MEEKCLVIQDLLRDNTSTGNRTAVLLDGYRVLRHECFDGEMFLTVALRSVIGDVGAAPLLLFVQGKVVKAEKACASLQPLVEHLCSENLPCQLKWTLNYAPYLSHHLICSA